MEKLNNRHKILATGLRLVHEHGYAGASVRDIVQAAGVPQGSFTNHFASKEAFGLEILNIYFADNCASIRATLRNDDLPPMDRLHAYFDANKARLKENGMRNGCLFGNFSAEIADQSEIIRLRLVEIFAEMQDAVAYCLQAGVAAGELDADLDTPTLAALIVSALQGAILLAKAQRSAAPVELFEQTVFSTLLQVRSGAHAAITP
jgi:TetR/AcrR family transcriptional repressor of nem operon